MNGEHTEKPATGPIRLGIAGLGLAGAFMIRAARQHPRFVLAAGMDPLERPRKAFSTAFDAPAYQDFDRLCEDENVEAIYISSPHRFHAHQTITALEQGKHVLVEKPLALTVEECDAVVEAAERTKRKVIVGHTHAFDPNVRAMRQLIETRDLGRVVMILSFNYTDYLYRPHAQDEFRSETGGGITFNQITHQVEVVRLLAGAPIVSVKGSTNILDPARPADGCSMVYLQFETGTTASLIYSGYDFFDSDEFHYWIAEGGTLKQANHGITRHTAMTRPSEDSSHQDLGFGGRELPTEQPFMPHFGVSIVTCERGDLRLSPKGITLYGVNGREDITVERGEGRPGQGDALDALWRTVREGEPTLHDARWGKATVEALVALQKSAKSGREVFLSDIASR